MINMSAVDSIRQQRCNGFSISDFTKMNGASRDTAYENLAQDDLSPRPPQIPLHPPIRLITNDRLSYNESLK